MSDSNNFNIEPLTRTQILVLMGVTAIILLVVAKIWQQLGSIVLVPVKFTSTALLMGVGLAVMISLASSLVYRFWAAYRRSADFYLQLILEPLVWADIVWLGLLPGLSEELLFRGVMLPALGFSVPAVIVSSVIFGVLHLSGSEQWPYVVWATAVGLILGFSALLTGNLLVPISAHIITNLVSSSLWKFQHSTVEGS